LKKSFNKKEKKTLKIFLKYFNKDRTKKGVPVGCWQSHWSLQAQSFVDRLIYEPEEKIKI
jgi:hypothetical protein